MSQMPDHWKEITAARIPEEHLAVLATLRDRPEITVAGEGPRVWVRWPPGGTSVVERLLAVPGVEFFTLQDRQWYLIGSRLPTADGPPAEAGRSLAGIVVPVRFEAIAPDPLVGPPVRLRAMRGGAPRPATALMCTVASLQWWCDTATTAELAAVEAAHSNGRAFLLGSRVPTIPGARRYWGEDLLVPLGFRPEPDLPAAVLRSSVEVQAGDLVLLEEDGVEVISRSALKPLTRAGIRLVLRDNRQAVP